MNIVESAKQSIAFSYIYSCQKFAGVIVVTSHIESHEVVIAFLQTAEHITFIDWKSFNSVAYNICNSSFNIRHVEFRSYD